MAPALFDCLGEAFAAGRVQNTAAQPGRARLKPRDAGLCALCRLVRDAALARGHVKLRKGHESGVVGIPHTVRDRSVQLGKLAACGKAEGYQKGE